MPFIVIPKRDEIAEAGYGAAQQAGDLCFIFYHEIMCRWFQSPRWTTIHALKKEYVIAPVESKHIAEVLAEMRSHGHPFFEEDVYTAAALAFDVFFHYYAMPYEDDKKAVNGDITPATSLRGKL